MDGKRSAANELFVCRDFFKGSLEISVEENYEAKWTARQIATDFMQKLRAEFVHSRSDLIRSALNKLTEISEAQSALVVNRDRIRSELVNLQRRFAFTVGRERYSVLVDALPHEVNSVQSGRDALPAECVCLFNDISIEERYAARYMLARHVSERKRIELSIALRSSIINHETSCLLRDELNNIVENRDIDQAKGDNNTIAFSEYQKKAGETTVSSLRPEFIVPTIASHVPTTQEDKHSRSMIVAARSAGSDAMINNSVPVSDTIGRENQEKLHRKANAAKLNGASQQVSTTQPVTQSADPELTQQGAMLGESVKLATDVNTQAPLNVNRGAEFTANLSTDRDRELDLVTRVNTELNTKSQTSAASLLAITDGGQVECSVVFCNKSIGPATLIAADKENYYVPAQVLANGGVVVSGLPPDFVQDVQENRQAPGWPVVPVLAPVSAQPCDVASGSGLVADADAAANAYDSVEIVATPQHGSRVRLTPSSYDQSVIETPSRNLMSVSTFMPPLSSTVIHPGILHEDDDERYLTASEYDTPKNAQDYANGAGMQQNAPSVANAAEHHLGGAASTELLPRCLTTPPRTDTDDKNSETDEVQQAAPSGVNPIADGYGMYVYDLKDGEDENDPNDALGVGPPPARRDIRLRKPRRSSTTFQRRAVVEMSPIVEVSSSSSSWSGSGSATASQSNCNSTNASRSRCTSVTVTPAHDSNHHRTEGDIAYETCNEIHEPSEMAEIGSDLPAAHVPSAFDYVRPLFPKGVTVLDVNANNIATCSESQSVTTSVWRENPCSTGSQLAKLEQSGFLRAIVEGHVDLVHMQIDSVMPEALTKLVDKARRSSTSSKYTSTVPYSTLNVSQSKVKHDGTFRLGSLTYDHAALVPTGAFANCFRLRRRTSECEQSIVSHNRRSEVLAKLFFGSPTATKADGANQSTIPDAERLRVEAIWETYVQIEISKRRAELHTGQPQDDTAHRFITGFMWLDHAVLLRNSAAIIYQLPDGAAVTLGALLDCARRIRAVDSTRSTTLPFNEPLAHLCTVELCELVRTLVRIGIVHSDIRAEKLMVARLTFDSKCCDSLRSGEPFLKLIDFSSAIDMKLYGFDSKFDSTSSSDDLAARRCGSACPAIRDLCPWSYDMDMYCTARVVQALIQSNNDTPDFEKRDGDWRESVPLKRRWNVAMWEKFFREMLRYQELTTRDATLAKLDGVIETLWSTFDQKRMEKVSSLMSDIKCLREHL